MMTLMIMVMIYLVVMNGYLVCDKEAGYVPISIRRQMSPLYQLLFRETELLR